MACVKKLKLPPLLLALLGDSALDGPVRSFADEIAPILTDNPTPFFPAYTDHGADHVERVLDVCVKLIPEDVQKNKDILTGADAAVLICAGLLHDIALHVLVPGFVELVSPDTRFTPVSWFEDEQEGRAADRPWHELWEAYKNEARHFGQSQLDRLLGSENRGVPEVAQAVDLSPSEWTPADYLLIGEFLRRHHARLAHEIAVHGFPGAGEDVLRVPKEIAEAAGVVARSHGEPLRRMMRYLDVRYEGALRPDGAVLPYLMALLRVADYLQIEADRAPVVLLRLKAPQSPLSQLEWAKHKAVATVSWDDRDPSGIFVGIKGTHGLRTHLALHDLLAGLQFEMDTSAAVISETYRTAPLNKLRLSRQRVRTDLDGAALKARLPFVPQRAELRSDEDLFRLVIDDLYGHEPAVAGRELVQNAVDAVRERRRLEDERGYTAPASSFREMESDVVVALENEDDERWVLRVSDRGVGMTPDTVINYFLRAGASLGPTSRDRERQSVSERVRTMKTGRFGVGVFASFLLGGKAHVTTRHLDADRGVSFTAELDGDLVELRWEPDAPLGTEIRVEVDAGRMGDGPRTLMDQIERLYALADPAVDFQKADLAGSSLYYSEQETVPSPEHSLPTGWRSCVVDGFDAVFWTPHWHWTKLVHNGITVRTPSDTWGTNAGMRWADRPAASLLSPPRLAVFDTRNRWPLALHRYAPVTTEPPFEMELLTEIGRDLLAYHLAGGPQPYTLGRVVGLIPVVNGFGAQFPLWPDLVRSYCDDLVLFIWRLYDPWPSINPSTLARRVGEALGRPIWATAPEAVRHSSARRWFDPSVSFWRPLLEASPIFSLRIDRESPRILKDRKVRPPVGPDELFVHEGFAASVYAGEHSRDPALERAIAEALIGQVKDAEQVKASVTAFRVEPLQDKPHPIAEAWMSTLQGPLELDSDELVKQRKRVLRRDPTLRPMVKDWIEKLDKK